MWKLNVSMPFFFTEISFNRLQEEPIKLIWDEPSESFFSPELEVATGVYRGNLVIDGDTYPIEDVVIKHYTFEADIYIKDGENTCRKCLGQPFTSCWFGIQHELPVWIPRLFNLINIVNLTVMCNTDLLLGYTYV